MIQSMFRHDIKDVQRINGLLRRSLDVSRLGSIYRQELPISVPFVSM